MNGLVSTPSSNITPENSVYELDGWFPAIDLTSLRDSVRIGEGIVSHERLLSAVEGAALTALRNLAKWRTSHAELGVTSLGHIDDISIGGEKRPVTIFNRIIRYYTAAELADTHRDISATNAGDSRADEENISADDYRRMANNAVSDLISIAADENAGRDPASQRNRVDLI